MISVHFDFKSGFGTVNEDSGKEKDQYIFTMLGLMDTIHKRKKYSKIGTILQLYFNRFKFKKNFIHPLLRVGFSWESENMVLVISFLDYPFLIFENTEQIHAFYSM